jgi:hypothetical protein
MKVSINFNDTNEEIKMLSSNVSHPMSYSNLHFLIEVLNETDLIIRKVVVTFLGMTRCNKIFKKS